ncbi:tetratricopeptide repeat protein [Pseudobythopirellula maris]|uniref:tetratricopeptide repeat protein n=1 Tax=Pseudobythopirellula maris TaxID=2527991 RepID=UPI0018D333EF|nr:tetratricopeptide repeat protein [Pseudobythopirellula maris]
MAAAALLASAFAAPLASAQDSGASASSPGRGLTIESLIGDSVSNANEDSYPLVADAIQRFTNEDPIAARTLLEQAKERDSKLPPVGLMIAKMYLGVGNGQAVRAALEQAVQQDSANDPEPFLMLGEDAFSGNRFIEADAMFDKAFRLIDGYNDNQKRKRRLQIRAYRGRGAVAQRRRDWQESLESLDKWLALDPDSDSAHNQKGQVLFMLGQEREGYSELVAAHRLNSKLPNPLISAGLMYSRLDMQDKALTAFERAYADDQSNPMLLTAYGSALIRTGDVARAQQILAKGRTTSIDTVNVWLLSGVAARMAGSPEQAEEYLLKAFSLAPVSANSRDVYNQLAQLLINLPEPENKRRALEFAELNARLNSDNPDVNITLAWVRYQLGQARGAVAALQKGLQGGKLSPDSSYLVAKILVAQGKNEQAKSLLSASMDEQSGIFVQRDEAQALLDTL